jgi:hypothetical protein
MGPISRSWQQRSLHPRRRDAVRSRSAHHEEYVGPRGVNHPKVDLTVLGRGEVADSFYPAQFTVAIKAGCID